MSYVYVAGKQSFYPRRRQVAGPDDGARAVYALGRSRGPRSPSAGADGTRNALLVLTEEQRLRLQSFVDRFDAASGLEPALRLVAAEVQGFFAFQACKVMQRLAKRFGSAPCGDPRASALAARCAETMGGADGVSVSRALWAAGKIGLRDEAMLQGAAARIPEVLGDCGPITMATIWNAFEVLRFEPDACLQAMAEQLLCRLHECDPPEIAIALHAAAQLRFGAQARLFDVLLPHVRQHEGTFSSRHLAVCLHAAARAGICDEELCHVVARRFTRSIAEIDAMALTSAVYACGLVSFFDRPFFEAVSAFLHDALRHPGAGLESQQVSNIVYTFGKLGFCPDKTLHAVVKFAIADLWRFKAQELDNLTYGFALLKFRNDSYLARLQQHLVDDGRVDKLDAQSLVSMAYSHALLGYTNAVALRAIGDRAIPKLHHFKAEEFSIMVYSLGVLNFRHHDLLTAVVEHVPRMLQQFSTQNVSNLLHGLSLVNFDRDDDFVRHVAAHLATRLPECSAQDIANPVTALMRMCIPHDGLMHAIASHLTAADSRLCLSQFTPQEIANTVYAFDALQFFHAPLFERIADATMRRLEEFIPQEVANVIWAFSKQSFGSADWFEAVIARCAPHAERTIGTSTDHSLSVLWCAEDLEKPLAALSPMREQVPSYTRLERVFRERFLDRIQAFLTSLSPQRSSPAPGDYQRDFAAWDLYQVGPGFTEELLQAIGVSRQATPGAAAEGALLEHYVGSCEDSLLSRFGDCLLVSVLPAARWVSSRIEYRLALRGEAHEVVGAQVVEAARPKEDEEANQRRFRADSWREPLAGGAYRPVLLSTFLGNWRHRHTELVALDLLVELALAAVGAGHWRWCGEDFWERLTGAVDLFVPHTPCLSCVGALAQLRCWCPGIRISVAYCDWREWRGRLRKEAVR